MVGRSATLAICHGGGHPGPFTSLPLCLDRSSLRPPPGGPLTRPTKVALPCFLPQVEYTYDFNFKRLHLPPPQRRTMHLLGEATPLAIDYKYKDKSDDHTRDDFHILKHVKITHFLMHMGLAGRGGRGAGGAMVRG